MGGKNEIYSKFEILTPILTGPHKAGTKVVEVNQVRNCNQIRGEACWRSSYILNLSSDA